MRISDAVRRIASRKAGPTQTRRSARAALVARLRPSSWWLDIPQMREQSERIAERSGGGEGRARARRLAAPTVTVPRYDPVPGARAARKAEAAQRAARNHAAAVERRRVKAARRATRRAA